MLSSFFIIIIVVIIIIIIIIIIIMIVDKMCIIFHLTMFTVLCWLMVT